MKKLRYLWGLIIVAQVACDKPNAPDCFQSSGDDAQEIREFPSAITAIDHNDLVDVVLVPGTESKVIVRAPENLIPEITTSFDNGVLKIDNKNTCNVVRNYDREIVVEVEVTEALRSYRFQGQGDVTCKDTLALDEFMFETYDGSGDIEMLIRANDVSCFNHTGVANYTWEGEADGVEWFHQGYGAFDADRFYAKIALTNNSSINRLRVHASEYLFAVIENSGSTYYRGEPGTIDAELNAAGELISLD